MGLFEEIRANMTSEELKRHEEIVADLEEHMKDRECPSGCGCVEFYDDREPEKATGGFGVAGCPCPRCNDGEEQQ